MSRCTRGPFGFDTVGELTVTAAADAPLGVPTPGGILAGTRNGASVRSSLTMSDFGARWRLRLMFIYNFIR